MAEVKADVAELKTDLAGLNTDVAEVKTDVADPKTGPARVERKEKYWWPRELRNLIIFVHQDLCAQIDARFEPPKPMRDRPVD